MTRRPRGLWALIFTAGLNAAAWAEHVTTVVVSEPGVGGLSGLEVSGDGRTAIFIGDRGLRVDAALVRGPGGGLLGLSIRGMSQLRRRDGRPVTGAAADAEGLACRAPTIGGDCNVSFEGVHRVVHVAAPDASAVNRADPEQAMVLQRNSGLEALAIDGQRRLLAIPERSGALDRPFPVLRLEDGRWTVPFALRRDPPFLPVGADVGPDGRLYLLERHFNGVGFRSRVRSFALLEDRVEDERTHFTSGLWHHDNLEGLAVWRDGDGAIRLTMVSDDNFNELQRTEIVEYRLP